VFYWLVVFCLDFLLFLVFAGLFILHHLLEKTSGNYFTFSTACPSAGYFMLPACLEEAVTVSLPLLSYDSYFLTVCKFQSLSIVNSFDSC
jgi:hypothetical protein